jgi:hypothetical protein
MRQAQHPTLQNDSARRGATRQDTWIHDSQSSGLPSAPAGNVRLVHAK